MLDVRTKKHATQQSLNAAIKSICDVMRRSNCAGALQYVPELTWILFLRILDEMEEHEAETAAAVGANFRPSLTKPYRWSDWAAPGAPVREKYMSGALGAFFNFVNGDLIPHLKKLRNRPNATPRQKVISEIMSSIDRTRIDTERNFCDVLDKVEEISAHNVDDTHIFTLSQVYEGLLLKMGEKGNDGGQFFTPREIIRAIVQAVDPRIGETVYDPCCGTGGFLAQAFEYMRDQLGAKATGDQLERLKHRTFYGREKENLVYPISLANLVLHGIDEPHIWHGNTLTGSEIYAGLFEHAPAAFDVILTNPPFGGKEGKEAQSKFAYKTGATQMLFLQLVIDALASRGRCGIVLDEGVLFRTNEMAFVQTKRRLLDACNLWCIVSLPGGVFTAAGAGVKTNVLLFEKGAATKKIWYYDLSDVKVGKKTPFTRERLKEFFELLPTRGDSERSWTVDITARRSAAKNEAGRVRSTANPARSEIKRLDEKLSLAKKSAKRDKHSIARLEEERKVHERTVREIEAKAEAVENAAFDLKAVNPNARSTEDTRSPEELLRIIDERGKEVAEILGRLRVR